MAMVGNLGRHEVFCGLWRAVSHSGTVSAPPWHKTWRLCVKNISATANFSMSRQGSLPVLLNRGELGKIRSPFNSSLAPLDSHLADESKLGGWKTSENKAVGLQGLQISVLRAQQLING